MIYTQSSLATEGVAFGGKNSNSRLNSIYNSTGAITKITVHHMAGNLDPVRCAEMHKNSSGSSANYYIGTDGKIVAGVPESRRAWTSSSRENDYKAITIEVANDINCEPWSVSDKALQATIDLCIDICKRNGIEKINYTGNANGNFTQHCYFANTACPGTYLKAKFPYIVAEINKGLGVSNVNLYNSFPTVAKPTLKKGSISEEVKNLQKDLNFLGYLGEDSEELVVDGIFGTNTRFAVKRFQSEHKIGIDGIYGNVTYGKMIEESVKER